MVMYSMFEIDYYVSTGMFLILLENTKLSAKFPQLKIYQQKEIIYECGEIVYY